MLGAVCLLLAATALQIIPFNWIGLLLVLGGVALLIAEVHVVELRAPVRARASSRSRWGAWLVFRVPELTDLALPFWRAIFPAVAALAVGVRRAGLECVARAGAAAVLGQRGGS